MKNKVITNYVKNNKFKMIIMLVVLLFIILFFIFSHLWHSEKQNKNQEMLLKEQEQITQMVDYLNKIDATIYDNKEDLAEVALNKEEREKILNTFLELLSNLEKELIQNGNIIETYRESQTIGNSEMLSFFDILLEKQKEIQVQIMEVNTEIVAILSDLREESENKYSLLFERIEKVQTALLKAEKSTKNYYSDLTELILLLQEENQDRDKELLESLILMQENISHLLNHNFSEIKMQLDEEFTMLIEKMNALHQQIDITGNAIAELCILLEENNENRQEEIKEAFASVKDLLGQIKEDYHNAYTEIQSLIQKLQTDENANHNETLSVLTALEKGMQESSSENFNQIINGMNELSNQYDTSLRVLKEELIEQYNSSANTLNEISKNVCNIGTGTENRFNLLETTLGKHYTNLENTVIYGDDGLREYLSGAFGSVEQRMEAVFQSVSDGKKLVASTLLTRGVSCAEDATFAEISQAILDIPYNLVIGETHMPGEIFYDYHYHTDRNGNITHDDTALQHGGCYDMPIYHIHTGDSRRGGGCYTIPIEHNHVDTCYKTTRIVREVTGSWFTGEGSGHGCCDDAHGENRAKYRYIDKVYINGELISSVNGEGDLGYCCGLCIEKKANKKASDKTESTITCGYSEGINGYDIGCGKSGSTVEAYRTGCGLSDGQIIGAHIFYKNNSSGTPILQLQESALEESIVQELKEEIEELESENEEIEKQEEVKKEKGEEAEAEEAESENEEETEVKEVESEKELETEKNITPEETEEEGK